MGTVVPRAWDEARELLDVPGLPVDPKMLPRPARVKIATVLAKQGWPQRLIGDALGVAQPRVSMWLRGDQPTWQQAAGRGPSTKRQPPRAAQLAAAPVGAGPLIDAPEPGEPWFDEDDDDDDDDDDDEDFEQPAPRPAPRPRAKPKEHQRFGLWTPMLEAAAARRGLDRLGQPLGAQQATTAPQEPATPAAAAPAPIPAPPALRPPVVTPQVSPVPARPTGIPARATEVGVRLACGCETFVLPASARPGAGWNCAGRHGATRVANLTGRYTMG